MLSGTTKVRDSKRIDSSPLFLLAKFALSHILTSFRQCAHVIGERRKGKVLRGSTALRAPG
jgi:hypothetical protein